MKTNKHKNMIILIVFVVIFIAYIITIYYLQNNCIQCKINKEDYNNTDYDPNYVITNDKPMRNNNNKKSRNNKPQKRINNDDLDNYDDPDDYDDSDDYGDRDDTQQFPPQNTPVIINNQTPDVIQRSPKQINALDRVYNPLRYPYKSDYFYDQSWYPNLNLPFQVIGGGYRNKPTLGGTQIPIYNPPVPINVSNDNIAPVYISTRGPLGEPQQVGVIYKINGNDNDVLPLYGRRKYPSDNIYEYYTLMGNFGVKVPVVTKNKRDELGSNDVVFIQGRAEPYRVTIYKSDMPSYIPYL